MGDGRGEERGERREERIEMMNITVSPSAELHLPFQADFHCLL